MSLTTNNVALLVHSCDRYELLYKGFAFFFRKYWDFDINCSYYFATEEKNVVIKGFENIRSGKGEWADRLVFLLKEKIREDYVLYFQEDMWLNKKVNARFFNQLFELTIRNNWQQVKLHSSEVYKTIPTNIFIEGFNITMIDNYNSGFLMSHQVTLWNKDFLLKQLHKKEHPWRNERKGTKRLKKLNPEIYHVDYFSENGKAEINKNNNPILRSEYRTISNNAVLNGNVEPFIEQLLKGDKEDQEYSTTLEHNYKNKLTHDGKIRPLKTDLFKRTKNWLKGK
ncbi:MAG: hypothetical protein M3342_16090 [Bacteroidota bacterium]|nr:hypothetical protein [Bacteroidota bacterium]